MRTLVLAAAAAAVSLSGCSTLGGGGYGLGSQYSGYSNYDYNRPDPAYGGYDADRYYVDNPKYRERRLSSNDRIYRGSNGRYYCRRNDGTTGLIVGGIAGGALGAAFTSGTLGTLLGAGAGALAGRAIDRNKVKCK